MATRRATEPCPYPQNCSSGPGPHEHAAPHVPTPEELKQRLLAAWRASGMPLGRLIVSAFNDNEEETGGEGDIGATSDAGLVAFVEQFVQKHPGTRNRPGSP